MEGSTHAINEVGRLQPKQRALIPLTIAVPTDARGGTYSIVVTATDDKGRTARGTVTVVVPKAENEKDGFITVTGGALTNPQPTYVVGDRLVFSYRITNTSTATTTVVPSGNLRDLDPNVDAKNCRWRNLAADGAYTCGFAYHVVTQADLDAGSFTPMTTWVSTSGTDTTTVVVNGPAVKLR